MRQPLLIKAANAMSPSKAATISVRGGKQQLGIAHQQRMMVKVASQLGNATVMGPAPNIMLFDFCMGDRSFRDRSSLRSCGAQAGRYGWPYRALLRA